jgi:peptide-methionine (S)-S-oxide reductase
MSNMTEKATFGAGCFWGVEATFRELDGVVDAVVGYEGGRTENPTYRDVCTDRTGHAEVVQVEYDPRKVSYDQLLDVFWKAHDPTQVNRQGVDIGTQYRSVIFFHSPEQEQAARSSKANLEKSGKFPRAIATQIEPAGPFYPAEDYHQQYLAKRGLRHCHI